MYENTHLLVQMKAWFSQIYPIPFLSLKKEIVLVKIYFPFFSPKFEQNLPYSDYSKLDAIAAIATFATDWEQRVRLMGCIIIMIFSLMIPDLCCI